MNKKPRLTDLCHDAVSNVLNKGDCAIDATAGNDHDRLFLSQAVGNTGHIIGFDIQQHAIDNTRNRLLDTDAPSEITLVQGSHGEMSEHIPADCKSRIRAVIFNLGYLLGSDKSVITSKSETLKTIDQALELIVPGGLLSIMAYPGHSGGKKKTDALIEQIESLDKEMFSVSVRRLHPGQSELDVLEAQIGFSDVEMGRVELAARPFDHGVVFFV